MPRRPHDRVTTIRPVLLLCCGVVLFGVMDGLAKLLAGEYSVIQLVWARYAFAVPVILLSARPAAWPGLLRCERPSLQAGRGLLPVEERLAALDRRLVQMARDGGACERLAGVPGIGPVIATALAVAVGDAKAFASGRHLAAWLGLVPRQHSSGGKERLLGISKRGDGYLRKQLM